MDNLLLRLINNGVINFSNLTFKDENVFNVNLTGNKNYLFENCSFKDVNMSSFKIKNGNFNKCKFKDVNMNNCIFMLCDFTGSSFKDVNFINCTFTDCTGLTEASYSDINMSNTKGIPENLINEDDDMDNYNMSGNYAIGMMSGGTIRQSNISGVNINSISGSSIISGNNIKMSSANGKAVITLAGVPISVNCSNTKVIITIGGKDFEIDKTIKQKEPIQYLDITAQIIGRNLFIVAESGGSIQMNVK